MIKRTIPYDELPELLTPAEVQAYLNLSRNSVYELLRRNELEHVRFGRLIRIPKTGLRLTEPRRGLICGSLSPERTACAPASSDARADPGSLYSTSDTHLIRQPEDAGAGRKRLPFGGQSGTPRRA
jgi:excisionase family DNA binding protein